MKVCVLTHVYPRFKNDPMPTFIEFTSENIQKLGVNVTVLTPYHPQFARTKADHTVNLQGKIPIDKESAVCASPD